MKKADISIQMIIAIILGLLVLAVVGYVFSNLIGETAQDIREKKEEFKQGQVQQGIQQTAAIITDGIQWTNEDFNFL